jgi:uncharacterized glyoxalase superfamily protein PhnB
MTGTTITPYLNYAGRLDEALEFYRKALGAEIEMVMRFNESPDPPLRRRQPRRWKATAYESRGHE